MVYFNKTSNNISNNIYISEVNFMRQVVFPNFFIFSACRDELSFEDNHKRTREVHNVLLDQGHTFATVKGVKNGQSEVSFMVFGSNAEIDVKELCKLYNQDCYLERDKVNDGYLVYPNGRREFLGKPMTINPNELDRYESYTVLPQFDGRSQYVTFIKQH